MAGLSLGHLSNGCREIGLLSKVLQGRFRPGLAKLVSEIVAEHLEANAEFRRYRYPWPKRLAMGAVSRPILAPVGVALFYGVIILATRQGSLPSFNLASDTAATIRDFWTINLGILGVQAALIGLVFPLVIAFVGLLNQGRASFPSRLTIYIEASVAIFVGVSSLLLCVAIVAQLPFSSGLGVAAAAVTVLNLVWFTINAGALAYFVLRTIDFIHPARRKTIMRAYVANVVWPRELAKAVTVNRWANVAEYNYLPDGERTGPFTAGGSARTWYTAMWDGGLPLARRHFRRKMRLVEVRLSMISPVIRAWLEEARLSDNGETHDFVIPLEPGRDYSGEQILVRATRPLSPVGRWAMRASLKFRRSPDENGIIAQTVSIFREMVADLIALIDARQADEFADQLAEVIAFHAFLYRLAQREVEDFNFAQLGPGGSLFGRSLSEEWARAYRDVIGRAVGAGEQAVVADAMESAGHDVEQEPTDELVGTQRRAHPLGWKVEGA